uniref:Fatty-acid amide hydrolase 1 n=1 Tax=Branchiostoma floridae TaxID=7739 RepID=C3YQI3_BRAFL|eukprot:XP_002601327.1 hypothetical protein BRAFLDRAFT_82774 [Branchiostoma floridae]
MSDFVVDFCWDVLEDSRLPLVVCTILVGVLTVYVGRKFYTRQQYKRKVQRKNEERQKALQDVLKSLDTDDKDVEDKRKDILTLTLPQLTQQLTDGQLSAVQVLQAYQEKGMANTLGLVKYPENYAEEDSVIVRVLKKQGAVPFVKTNGMANTLGLVKYLENYAEEDSVIVRVLKKQGAVPFVKTNVPQTLIDTGCSNPLFGTTLNPRDPTRSPGGSSGGEAALIGGGGSILGIGNDIGGSLRIPAHFCGICGFKPTANRLSKQGYFNCSPGQQGLTGTCGPMARDVDSLVLVMKALLVPDMFQLDPLVPPIPFRQEIYESKKPLKIGYILDWELKMATPALTRAVKVMKDALEKAGHELVPFQPPKSDNAFYDISPKCLLADGGKTIRDRIHLGLQECSLIVCFELANYTSIFNLLNFPAGVVPVTKVTEEDDRLLDDYTGSDNDIFDRFVRKVTKGAVGMPVAVQIMSDFVVDFCWDVLEDSRLPLVVCTTLVGVLTVYVGRKFYTRQQYKRKVQRKNEERQKALQDVLKSLDTDDKDISDKRNEILTLTLPQLTQQLGDGQLSAVQVLQAYQEKALAVHGGINCITEPIPNALARAQELDSTDQKSGLLYGVPVSIKDNINIKGMANTLGLVKYLENYAEEDSVIVRVLKKQGAVPFVKTNVPQLLFDIGCGNPLFGTTLNPRDPTRSPGGSSGGEAALIGGGGSILGIGNDVGGSIRIPAHFCGICGFKPTANRLSKKGYFTAAPGQQGLVSTCGPMARDVDSLVLVMKALLVPDMFQLDPLVPPIPFRQEIYESKTPLKIGYFLDWELALAAPALTRAVKITKEALEKAGHKLVPFQPPQSDHAFHDIIPKCLLADGGETIRNQTTYYTNIFNLLNFPAGVVPVTKVTEEDDRLLDDIIGSEKDPFDRNVLKVAKGAVGMPVAVQCVALPWQEEACLRLMKEVETRIFRIKEIWVKQAASDIFLW